MTPLEHIPPPDSAPDHLPPCSYTPAVAGFYRLHVTHKGAPLPRTPFSVQVGAGCWWVSGWVSGWVGGWVGLCAHV